MFVEVQIENRDAVEKTRSVEEIASIDGLGVLFIE